MSSGAKAGLAIGIIIGIGALIALVLFCYRRKKKTRNEAYEKTDDEKFIATNGDNGLQAGRAPSMGSTSTRTASNAPRLSLRPVTQFLPDLAARRKSSNLLAGASGINSNAHDVLSASSDSVLEKASAHIVNDPENPFGNYAETSNHGLQSSGPSPDISVPTPIQIPAPLSIRAPTPEIVAAGAGLGAAVGATTAQRQNIPKSLLLTQNRPASPALSVSRDAAMPSPSGTDFSMTSVASGTGSNGVPSTNVHRIQLDFKPSMEDELELRAGQLVRLLHEYDDGWVSHLRCSTCLMCTSLIISIRHCVAV